MKSASKPPVSRKPPPTPSKPTKPKPKDPVEVYCRIRPLRNPTDSVGAFLLATDIVQLVPPTNELGVQINRNLVLKGTQHTFKYVFNEKHCQKNVFDRVAKPLVEDLLLGKNGLLFTYGVTGSGKTFTMTGNLQDGGILPRSLDVIFNSIGSLQARKYVFKPDKMNGFDVQSDADAMLDRQKDILYIPSATPKTPRRPISIRKPTFEMDERIPDLSKIEKIDEDTSYAVFVQYIEIYNNYVYDLLEDTPIDINKSKAPQSRVLREDAARNMYVHCCTEVEVKNTEEVFEVFYRGQKRRRVAHTTLNAESSRSHSVFTIRLVQSPLDSSGLEVLQDKSVVTISQLSLVDLAGSERTVRTKNYGERLREAGNINNSLMALRTCIENLRENQIQGTNKLVPYRESKLTHLFKNYFDGEGKVRMIVCISPSSEDYDENIHVMKFAEITQEVQVARPQPKLDLGLTPGRRKANIINEKLAEIRAEVKPLMDLPSFGTTSLPHRLSSFNFPPYPIIDINNIDEDTLPSYLQFLTRRSEMKQVKLKELKENQMAFRNILVDSFKELELLRQQNVNLNAQVKQDCEKMGGHETKLNHLVKSNECLLRQLEKSSKEKNHLQQELSSKVAQINTNQMEKLKLKVEMDDRLIKVREKMSREVAKQISANKAQHKAEVWVKDEKLRCVRDIVKDMWVPPPGHKRKLPLVDGYKLDTKVTDEQETPTSRRRLRSTSPSPERGIPVANPKHRRSLSASATEKWVDHAPEGTVELGTLLQPSIKNKKSVSKLNVKDILNKDAAHYVLTHQEQDKQGDIETSYFKGSVIPSCTGGAQVIFNDVETLKQTSPSKLKKRSIDCVQKASDNANNDPYLEDRCRTAIEGHFHKKKSRP